MTAPIETSATSGSPSLDGIAIASGFVPVSGGPPDGGGSRRGDVAVTSATYPGSGEPPSPVAEGALWETPRGNDELRPQAPSRITSSQIAASVR